MNKTNKIKVCIMVSSLGMGGAERSSAILSKMLVDAGYEVTIISILDAIVYDYKGVLVNLGSLTKLNTGVYKRLRKLLITRKTIQKGHFDYIIDTMPRATWFRQWFINTMIYKKIKTVFIIHNYNLKTYFPKSSFLARDLYKNSYALVGVSKAIKKHVRSTYSLSKVSCIYNAFESSYWERLSQETIETLTDNYVLAYGRIDDKAKDFSFLIKAYSKSELPKLGIRLMIIGDGPDTLRIKKLIAFYQVEKHVIFKGFTSNPFPYIKQAMYTTLTSNYEGFPMVLIESLAMGTPVVSVNCKSGPSEVIVTGKNGILVPLKEEQAFSAAMNKMITDKSFYNSCKTGTVASVSKFKTENIIPQWQRILPPKI